MKISQAALVRLIRSSGHYFTEEVTRFPGLDCMRLEFDGFAVTGITTDGKSIAWHTIDSLNENGKESIQIPRELVAKLSKLPATPKNDRTITLISEPITAKMGDKDVTYTRVSALNCGKNGETFSVIAGENLRFPQQWRNCTKDPNISSETLTIPAQDLREILAPSSVLLSVNATDVTTSARSRFTCTGAIFSIRVDPRAVLAWLPAKGAVRVFFYGEDQPLLLIGDDTASAVIMPQKLDY